MPRPLFILGAGGFARETAQAVGAVNGLAPTWDLLGFLDDDPALEGKVLGGLPVLGPIQLLQTYREAAAVICVGRPDNYVGRIRIAERLDEEDERYACVVHPSVALGTTAVLGAGSVLLAHTALTADVVLGRHVAVMPHTVLTHDVRIDDYATIASGVLLGGGVHVQEGAYLGSGARVREAVIIGAWSMIGMGSVVTRNVPPHRLWVGTPARDRSRAPLPDQWHRGAG